MRRRVRVANINSNVSSHVNDEVDNLTPRIEEEHRHLGRSLSDIKPVEKEIDAHYYQNQNDVASKILKPFPFNPEIKMRDVECSICMDTFVVNNQLLICHQCLHCFHSDCLSQWINMHRQCPMFNNDLRGFKIAD